MIFHSLFFSKKSGLAGSRSQRLGVLAELLFALFCILAGIVGILWIFICFIVPEWDINQKFESTTCTMVDSRIVENRNFPEAQKPEDSEKSTLFGNAENEENDEEDDADYADIVEYFGLDVDAKHDSEFDAKPDSKLDPKFDSKLDSKLEKTPDSGRPLPIVEGILKQIEKVSYQPEVLVAYEVDGRHYQSWASSMQSVLDKQRFENQKDAEDFIEKWKEDGCHGWFDPEKPENIVIFKSWTFENYFSLLIPVSFFFIGCGMLYPLGRLPRFGSEEFSALFSRPDVRRVRKQLLDTKSWVDLPKEDVPTCLPSDTEIMNSPGVRLAYRLPVLDSPVRALFLLMGVTLVWNVLTILLLTIIVCSSTPGERNWVWFVYAVPFVLAGLGLIFYTSRKIRAATVIGPTLVEIDRYPLHPGESATLFVSQCGRAKIFWMNAMLVCEEEVVFTHGTNTRCEIQRVFQRLIYGEDGVEMPADGAFEVEFPLEIPPHVMHSFVSPRNQIHWKLIVQVSIAGSPPFERSFPILIYPKTFDSREAV